MEILKRSSDFPEPSAHNYVKISRLPSGDYGWSGAVQPPRETAAVYNSAKGFPSADRAIADATAWAQTNDAKAVFVIYPEDYSLSNPASETAAQDSGTP